MGQVWCQRTAHLHVELHDEGLLAQTTVTIDGHPTDGPGDLAEFLQQLADDWRGWRGRRVWHALGRELTVEATPDVRGYVALEITVRRHRWSYANDVWSATIVLMLEAGEQIDALAREVRALLSSG